jgi:hypothetical protein
MKQSLLSLRTPRPYSRTLGAVGITLGTLLFSGVALAKDPACHKTAVCLMKAQEAKERPPVEARASDGVKAPCSHKTAVCDRTRMEAPPKVAKAKPSEKKAVPFCSHKTAVCLMQQAQQKKS